MTTLLEGDRLKLTSQVLVTGQAKHQMTVLSPVHLILKGTSAGQVVALPSALTLKEGWTYIVTNNSSQPVMVRDFVGNLMGKIEPEERLELLCLDNKSPKGEWCKSLVSVSHDPVTNCLFDMIFHGTGLANEQWLSYHPALESSKIPCVIPFELCRLVGLAFSNSQQEASASIQIYKNGTTDLNLFYDYSVVKCQSKAISISSASSLSFKKEDSVSVYLKTISGNDVVAENATVTLYFKIVKP